VFLQKNSNDPLVWTPLSRISFNPGYKNSLGNEKGELNNLISFVQKSKNEEITTYYGYLRHLRELITKEMLSKSA
jgi:hypothetical protein